MLKIPFHPDSQAYTATPSTDSVREVKLQGGKSYRRKGLINGTWTTTVQFTCDRDRYDLLCGFYALWEDDPGFFLVNLILNSSQVQEYQASFIADTWKLASQRGHTYVVTASLEVKPKKRINNDLNAARAIFIGIYGDEVTGKRVAMDPLYEVINVTMPLNESDHVN